jgi:signal peptidase I
VKTKSKSPIGQLVELVVIVATALALALGIQAFLVKPYRIPSSSMVPTLDVGQRVLVNRIGMHFGDPSVGDIMVFHPPAGADDNVCGAKDEGEGEQRPCGLPVKKRSDENFIKRVVAGPGDTVAIVNGHAIVNGKRQKDPFTEPCPSGSDCNFPKPIKVPPDHWFMMGDNRGHSDDSRYWGPVPRKWIIGDAFATYWPPDRIGIF